MQRYPVTIAGVDLEIEQHGWRKPRLLRQGVEVPRDRWENYVVTDAEGKEHRPEFSYNRLHLSPVIHDPAQRSSTVVAPLPRALVVLVIGTLVLGLLGGFLGVVLVSIAQGLTIRLIRRADRGPLHIAVVILVWAVLVALGVVQVARLLG